MADDRLTPEQAAFLLLTNRRSFTEADAISVILRTQPQWISVETMPPDAPKKGWKDQGGHQYKCSDSVLAFNGELNVAEVLTNPKGDSVWVSGDETLTRVTHWAHLLPAPPEGA